LGIAYLEQHGIACDDPMGLRRISKASRRWFEIYLEKYAVLAACVQ
jgi:hypothetical protein